MKRLILAAVLLPHMAMAQGSAVVFDIGASEACSEEAVNDAERAACVGVSMRQCIANTPGAREAGSGQAAIWANCANAETQWWQARMDYAYEQLMQDFAASDAGLKEDGTTPYPKAKALEDLQAAWLEYRAQSCVLTVSLRGHSPAAALAGPVCFLRMTGAQALFLESLPWED